MRVETGDAVETVERNVDFRGERLEFFGGQVTETVLDFPQTVENQRESPRERVVQFGRGSNRGYGDW